VNVLIGTVLLWSAAFVLWRRLALPDRRAEAIRNAWTTLLFTLPRTMMALLGAELITELLPQGHIEGLFGSGSGAGGILIASVLGPITPGGAFVSFAIGAAALKNGATWAPVIAYVTSWSLFSLTKILAYELPLLGRHATWWRIAVSLPVPLIVGAGTALLT
jgi:hypothetical protein